MSTAAIFPGISITAERVQIPVATMAGVKKPDQDWKHFDYNGHAHAFNGDELPTLEWVVTGQRWAGDEYDGSEYDIGEWRCRICAAVVEPEYIVSHAEEFIAGPPHLMVNIDHGGSYPISAEDAATLTEILGRVFHGESRDA